jgi:hypothetical protein
MMYGLGMIFCQMKKYLKSKCFAITVYKNDKCYLYFIYYILFPEEETAYSKTNPEIF